MVWFFYQIYYAIKLGYALIQIFKILICILIEIWRDKMHHDSRSRIDAEKLTMHLSSFADWISLL